MKYTIIATGYNCEKYADECIQSVINQTHKDWELFVYDDGSTDSTFSIVKKYSSQNIKVIRNYVNAGALKGRFEIIHNYASGDVVCFLGLDDYLKPNALEILETYYKNEEVLMTWGSWEDQRGYKFITENYSDKVWDSKNFRCSAWKATALNTFKVEMIKKVDKYYLLKDNKFMTNCTDLAYSFPCLEMIKKENARVIIESIYVYRINNTNSTLKRFGRIDKTENREYLKNMKAL